MAIADSNATASPPRSPSVFGLSYTTFALSDLRLARDTIGPDDAVVATLDVTNTGDRAGEEIVQLYIGARSSNVERAPKELKAFTSWNWPQARH
jgi:beta-glucosidase